MFFPFLSSASTKRCRIDCIQLNMMRLQAAWLSSECEFPLKWMENVEIKVIFLSSFIVDDTILCRMTSMRPIWIDFVVNVLFVSSLLAFAWFSVYFYCNFSFGFIQKTSIDVSDVLSLRSILFFYIRFIIHVHCLMPNYDRLWNSNSLCRLERNDPKRFIGRRWKQWRHSMRCRRYGNNVF